MIFKSRRTLLVILVSLTLCACVGEGALKLDFNNVPSDLGDDWQIGTPASQNIDAEAIDFAYREFFSDDEFLNAISLLIIRNNVLVAEGYARHWRDQTHYEAVQSITKSVTSLLTGVAIDEGLISSLDTTLEEIYPEKFVGHPDRKGISLRHLLTMSSGIDFDNDRFHVELSINKPRDTIDYILDKPSYNSPGEEFYYRDADPHLLSYAIQVLSGESLASYAKARLFQPLGITDYNWISDGNHISFGAYGIYLKPRDLAKIGQLVLQQGQWQGQQIVAGDWIDASTQKQIEKDDPTTLDFDYGYYWWVIPELNAFTAWGHGGNFVVVMPDKQMVVVLTSFPNSGNGAGTHLNEFMPVLRRLYEGAK